MKHRLGTVIAMLLGLTIASATSAAAQPEAPAFEPADCAFAVPAGYTVECGCVVVPETWETGAGEVRMATARWSSISETPAPDPVVFLQGGPGGGGVVISSQVASVLIAPILESRDFITYDQRGTGLSTPALHCPELTAITIDDLKLNYSIADYGELSLESFTSCSARLRGAGVDLTQYTSAASARDIAAMLDLFGVEQANLLGGSYGTRLAQTVARDFPERVRSLVLDSPIPVDYNIFEVQGPKTREALDAFFTACAADAACAAAYPDLERTLFDTIDALNRTPAQVPLTHPITGEALTATIDGTDLMAGVFFGLQTTGLIPTLPATIQAASEGDFSALTTFLTIPLVLTENINIGMFMSVNCAEEAAFTTAERLDTAAARYPEVQTFTQSALFGGGQALLDACQAWGAAQLDALENAPVVSSIPTLILAGQFDPATPPTIGEALLPTFASSTLVVIPGAGHGVSFGGGCPMSIVTSFLSDPAQGADTSCAAAMTAAFAVPGAALDIALSEVSSETFGWTTVLPEGWSELAPGTYGESMSATASIVVQFAPVSADEMKDLLAQQFGLDAFPEPQATVASTASTLTWSVYKSEVQGLNVDIALAESDGGTALILMIAPQAESDAYYQAVVLPAIDNFRLNS